jgi:Bacterial membrane protein YfhO
LKLACCIAVSLALCFLGGFPNFFFYTCLIVGTYFGILLIFSWNENKLGGSVQRVGLMVVAVILVTGLVAIQLLPAYELSALSVRSLHSTSAYDPNSPWENYSAALAFGNFLFPDQAFLYANRLLKMDSGIYYLGASLLLVPFAFRNKQHRVTAIALSASCAILLLFTVSHQIPALSFVHDIPLVGSMRVNGRAVAYFAFFLIVLASLGLSDIGVDRANGIKPPTSNIWGALLLAACTAAMMAVAITAARHVWAVAGLVLCAGLIIYSMLGFGNTSRSSRLGWVIVFIIVIDVSIHRENRFLVPAFNTAVNPFVERSSHDYQVMDDYYRLLLVPRQLDDTYTLANLGLKLGIPNISAYDSFTHARWLNYLRSMVGPEPFDRMVKGSPLQRFYGDFTPQLTKHILRDDRILGLASVRYLYSQQGKSINEHALPRAYAVRHYIRTENEEQSLSAIKANMGALRASVVIENASTTYSPDAHDIAQEGNEDTVHIMRHAPNEVELAVAVTKPSIVVLTDAYYPGWKATVDGRNVDIFRANSLFRAVEVPAGTHSVLFRYQPTSFYLGIGISLLTLCFAFLLSVTERHFHRYRRSISSHLDRVNWN